jgi:hypothetical protein
MNYNNLTSPLKSWKAGDIFIKDNTHWGDKPMIGRVKKIVKPREDASDIHTSIYFDPIYTTDKDPYEEGTPWFDVAGNSFEQNKIFKIEDDKLRAFNLIFA